MQGGVITPLNGKNVETRKILLSDACESRAPFTRYHMEMKMSASDTVVVKVSDLGFGELFVSNGNVWEESFQVP